MMSARKLILILACVFAAAPARAGNDGPHGGDPLSQKFTQRGYQAVELLDSWSKSEFPEVDLRALKQAVARTYVRTAESVAVRGPDGRPAPRAAMNEPDRLPPTITVSRSWPRTHPMSEAQEIGLALHEYLGILKVEQDINEISARFLKRLAQARPATAEASSAANRPVVLTDYFFERGRQGFSWQTAQARCARFKQLFRDRYFFVYCVFHQKNWRDSWIEWESIGPFVPLGFVNGEEALVMDGSGIRTVYIPVPIRKSVHGSVYGIRVMGLGSIHPGSPDRSVYASEDGAPGLDAESFESERAAQLACARHVMLYGEGDPRFHRAECRVYARSGRHFYEIVTRTRF